jgi:5-(carboxyamino)imidazole ribonucleotide mutase
MNARWSRRTACPTTCSPTRKARANPVLGVPVPSKHLAGVDSLHSIVQMPKGVPVATFAIGDGGAANAALFAVAMLALHDPALAAALDAYRARQTDAARAMSDQLK